MTARAARPTQTASTQSFLTTLALMTFVGALLLLLGLLVLPTSFSVQGRAAAPTLAYGLLLVSVGCVVLPGVRVPSLSGRAQRVLRPLSLDPLATPFDTPALRTPFSRTPFSLMAPISPWVTEQVFVTDWH